MICARCKQELEWYPYDEATEGGRCSIHGTVVVRDNAKTEIRKLLDMMEVQGYGGNP